MLSPSFLCGSVIHMGHLWSHGRFSGWWLSLWLARIRVPLCVSASIVPRHTCVSFEFFGLATYFGTRPSNGHIAQQSGCSAGNCTCMIFLFGIILFFF